MQDPGRGRLGAEADDALAPRRDLRAIDALSEQNRAARDPQIERRLLRLRHRAGLELRAGPRPTSSTRRLPSRGSRTAPVSRGRARRADARTASAAILRRGCLLVRGLVEAGQAARLAEGIDSAFQARDERDRVGRLAATTKGQARSRVRSREERWWLENDAGGVWSADSPGAMFDMLEAFERSGLQRLATEYLGERPAIAVNKSTLRRVEPEVGKGFSLWHQDEAFLGDVPALNVWLSLSRCGDLAPGLDIVPAGSTMSCRPVPRAPSSTGPCRRQWSRRPRATPGSRGRSLSPATSCCSTSSRVHATAAEPEMPNPRYAIRTRSSAPRLPRQVRPAGRLSPPTPLISSAACGGLTCCFRG